MSRMRLDRDTVESAVLGGAVLGGGGGGSMDEGRRHGAIAIEWGAPDLIDIDDLPPDATIVTASAVGSPASRTAYSLPAHYVRAVELLAREGGITIQGLVTSECGGIASTNGWVQAAALGIPVVDAPCNGRAHPIALMGSIGLHRLPDYSSMQTAAGGNPAEGRYLELFVRGKLDKTSAMVLHAAIQSGGMVAVARNPVSAEYARGHAAVGGLKRAIQVGRAMMGEEDGDPMAIVEAACTELGGEVAGRGQVTQVTLETRGGLDVGTVLVKTGDRETLELTFWNEYMTLEAVSPDGSGPARRLATFPDLMSTFDATTGAPLSSALIREGQRIAVIRVPREKLILGAGMKDPELMRIVESTVGKEVVKYIFP